MLSCIADFLDRLEPVDILRAGALIVFFGALILGEKRRNVWFRGETAALAVGGLMWILVPNVLVEIQSTAKADPFHNHVGEVFGVGLLSLAVSHGKTDKGENVNLARIIASFAASASFFVGGLYGYFKYAGEKNHLTIQYLTIALLMTALWCISNIVLVYREFGSGVGYNNYEDANRQLIVHQLVDLLILALAVSQYCGLNVNLQGAIKLQGVKIDGIHLTMFRGLGGIFMYKFIMVLSTLIFQSEDPSINAEQAKDNFVSRIFFFVVANSIVLFHQYAYGMFGTNELYMRMGLGAFVIINSLLGIKAAEKDISG